MAFRPILVVLLLGFGPRTAGAIRDLSVALYGDTVQN